MNRSDSERFETAYRRIWAALSSDDEPGFSHHARQVLHHVPASGGISLTELATHLHLPKSTTSVLVKELASQRLVSRARDAADERRLAIVLTDQGRHRVEADTVLAGDRLAAALARLPEATRSALLAGIEELAAAGERPHVPEEETTKGGTGA